MADIARSTFAGLGYFGPAHRDSKIASQKRSVTDYVARFKHGLLFTPKIVLADHMMFSPNFKRAYETDASFRSLLRDDLVDIAHFEKFYNGRPLTLVEMRMFYEYLRRGEDKRFDPRNPDCPSEPFDAELRTIQDNVGRLYPDGARRDPLFTAFVDLEFETGSLRPIFGNLYSLVETAFDRMRSDNASRDFALGIIHFDEEHKVPGTENLFDYMSRESSLKSVPRDYLVREFSERVAGIHRTLLIKAEMALLSEAHAIVPADLRPYRTLVFSNLDEMAIDQREAAVREEPINLESVSPAALATLSLQDVTEIRKSGEGFFSALRENLDRPERFDETWKELRKYCQAINGALYGRPNAAQPSRLETKIRLVQGKLVRHAGILTPGIAMAFKVVTALAHTGIAASTGILEAGGIADVPLEAAEHRMRKAIQPKSVSALIDDVKSTFVVSGEEKREFLMSYE